ncbi:DUF4625 domain-containing protein [Autumnicola musiva]|uniref:DUF4625 domain-containing protein n=1 Tax=Autumnicola musiva TaxID=3075589 RepID=A0ABU3DAH1_9FLAO|nr:DUF4625 domain-containing protein [Zunongwangia sp. F117]MDT0678535.1 DUF4625 domain-containing protein [Zunongwangia sp. F117]
MKIRIFYVLAFISFLSFTSCSNDDDQNIEPAEATLTNIEIGLNNNERGIIGRDFHLNADIVAGERIDMVSVDILPREHEEYAGDWSFNISWDEYSGLRNTTVHKHFDIPDDAVEGVYDFIITVSDENGSISEEVRTITIFLPENLPVDPDLTTFNLSLNGNFIYRNGEFTENETSLKVNDTISSQADISSGKGDGKMYLILINASLDHRPETIDAIDFSKVIVYDYYEHSNWTDTETFSNFVFDLDSFEIVRDVPQMVIGAESDNAPEPNPIEGEKQWETGTYYFGLVYENTTYNVGLFHYIEIEISGF